MAERDRSVGRLAPLVVLLSFVAILGGCGLNTPTATNRPAPATPWLILPRVATIDNATKPGCADLPAASALPYPGRVGQTWYAEQIIVGVVTEQVTRWEGGGDSPSIISYSLVRVEETVRGKVFAELVVQQAAGTIDGCTQLRSDALLDRGVRLLLWLNYSYTQPGAGNPPIFRITFENKGSYSDTSSARFDQVVAEVRQTLSQPPPSDLPRNWVVPLERAPLVPLSTATPRP